MSDDKRPRGIPTEYRGVNFRSLLEARFAILWDLLNVKWSYEAIELDGYIPDFLLETEIWCRPQVRGPVLVEVRPHLAPDEFRPSIDKIARSGWRGPAIVVGPMVRTLQSPYGLEQSLGYGHPSVDVAHANADSKEWYTIGFCVSGEATGKFAYGGQADLTALMREATNRSQWMPRR